MIQYSRPDITAFPFRQETSSGLTAVEGEIQLAAEGITLQFKILDSIVGVVKSSLKTLHIPPKHITRLEYHHGWLRDRLIIGVDTVAMIHEFPDIKDNSLKIKLRKIHREAITSQLMQHINQLLDQDMQQNNEHSGESLKI